MYGQPLPAIGCLLLKGYIQSARHRKPYKVHFYIISVQVALSKIASLFLNDSDIFGTPLYFNLKSFCVYFHYCIVICHRFESPTTLTRCSTSLRMNEQCPFLLYEVYRRYAFARKLYDFRAIFSFAPKQYDFCANFYDIWAKQI